MYAVVVNEGPLSADDNATYFTREMPEFEAVNARVVDDEESFRLVVFARFTPMNGRQKGQLMRVPFGRIVGISDDEPRHRTLSAIEQAGA